MSWKGSGEGDSFQESENKNNPEKGPEIGAKRNSAFMEKVEVKVKV